MLKFQFKFHSYADTHLQNPFKNIYRDTQGERETVKERQFRGFSLIYQNLHIF